MTQIAFLCVALRRMSVVVDFVTQCARCHNAARRAWRARGPDRRIPRLLDPQPSRIWRPSSSFHPREGAPPPTSSPLSGPARARAHPTPQPVASKFGPRRAVLEPCGEPHSAHASARPAPPCAPPLRRVPWPVSTLRPTCRALSSPPCRLTLHPRSRVAGTTGSRLARTLDGR